ncbi:SAG family member [Eimeria brunetti]|uniref:SAG family member n=1 Tax=Eimeria brunetti TaxID=51314 RepID=U6LAT0_9EIME|nr:SAG family member [Eimeria brunetti]
MPSVQALTVVGALFLLLVKASGIPGAEAQQAATTKFSVTFEQEDTCLPDINAARVNAGFKEFTVAQNSDSGEIWPAAGDKSSVEDYKTWVWKPVCDFLLGETTEAGHSRGVSQEAFVSGTYAFKVVDGGEPNCTDVVNGWKDAYTNFNGIPPAKEGNEDVYKVHENVSFVAMYNPSANAAASCRVVTCTKTVSVAGAGGKAGREGSEAENTKTGSALLCLTTPDILFTKTDSAPFTEDQWAQIVTAFEGSASAALPTLLGLVAAVLGVVATV